MPGKFTKNDFIAKSVIIYGDKYDYTEFNFIDNQTEGIIKCNVHNLVFTQKPANHVRGYSACPKCTGIKGAIRKLNTDDLILRAKELHNNQYTYDNIGNPKVTKDEITVYCTLCNTDFKTSFDAHVYHKVGCKCSTTTRRKKCNDAKKLLNENYNAAVLYPHLVSEWSDKNHKKLHQLLPQSKYKGKWNCLTGHYYEMWLSMRISGKNCPHCNMSKLYDNPDAVAMWDPENERGISEFSYGSGQVAKFICDCVIDGQPAKHKFTMRICNFNKGERCPFKAGKLVDETNSLLKNHPEFMKFWDYERNTANPSSLTYGSGVKVWLKCEEGHSWQNNPNAYKPYPICRECYVTGQSVVALAWLESLNLPLQHARDGGEFRIPGTNWRADGYHEATNTIYEFHGSFWHGDSRLYAPDEINVITGKTHGHAYQKTIDRDAKIRELGYNLVVMWEKDWYDLQRLKK